MIAEPTTTNATAPEIAGIFFKTVFHQHGLPRVIVSDRDPKFTSHFWQALFKTLGTQIAMSTAFHPQTDGQTERMNRTLEQMLRNYVSYEQDDWDHYLTYAEFAYNNAVQSSTGLFPFWLLHGQDPETPASLVSNQKSSHTQVPTTQNLIDKMDTLLKIATMNLQKAQQHQAKYADKKR
jgi:transposase InsO family protein